MCNGFIYQTLLRDKDMSIYVSTASLITRMLDCSLSDGRAAEAQSRLTVDSAWDRLSDLLDVRVWSAHVSQPRPTSTDALDKLVPVSPSVPPSLSLSGCLSPLSLARSSHSLLGIRPQPQCCDGRWQLAQKGWHVIGKCAAPKMSFLIKRF